jgi:DNA-binding transcriptional LysR family regulator
MPINLHRLDAFCAVVDQQSISRAADRLVVTQPVVSRLVAELERHFGTRLLVRRGRRVVPTEAGLTVYRYARGVLQSTRETEQLVRELLDGDGGLIAIAVATAICSYTFPPVWRRFAVDHPRTQLVLHLGDSHRVLEETLDGTVDLGLALPGTVPGDLAAQPLGPVEVLLVASATHPLAGRTIEPEEMVGQTFLCTNSTPSYENLTQNLAAAGVSGGYSVAHFGDTETVKRGVEAGLGLAQLARAAVARELAAGTVAPVSLDGQRLPPELFLVQRKEPPRSTVVGAFAQFLVGQADALCGRGEL